MPEKVTSESLDALLREDTRNACQWAAFLDAIEDPESREAIREAGERPHRALPAPQLIRYLKKLGYEPPNEERLQCHRSRRKGCHCA